MAKIVSENKVVSHRWYNEEHMPRVLARISGVISGRSSKIMEEEEYEFLSLYEFVSYQALDAAAKSDAMKQLVEEYDATFGKGGRKRLKTNQIKSLIVG